MKASTRQIEPTAARKPALLISFVYLKPFLKLFGKLNIRNWVLDSGAFSAATLGVVINLQDFIDTAKRLLTTDPLLAEIFALDVIGDWRAGLRNTEEMWKQGIEAIPCYHYGEPESVLRELVSQYPKIALGGGATLPHNIKMRWAEQCFARIWPKRVHGFGFGGERYVNALPFDSVDASSWVTHPQQFGKWRAYGDLLLRSKQVSVQAEIDWYLRMERQVQFRWQSAMREIESQGPTVRFAASGSQLNYFLFKRGTNDTNQ